MKFMERLNLPTLTELGEFGKTEFRNGMADIWQALIAEGWTGQSRIMLGSDLSDDKRADRHADNPLLNRTDGSDFYRAQVREDREQELDFDR
jgi:hypothetical protein